MEEMFTCEGTLQEAAEYIAKSGVMSQELAIASLNYLLMNPEVLDKEQETILTREAEDKVNLGATGFIAGNSYYINLSKTALITGATLVSSAMMHLCGADGMSIAVAAIPLAVESLGSQFGFRLYSERGEKCIIRELAIRRRIGPVAPKEIRRRIKGQCSKDYCCDYRKKGRCECKKKDIKEICENLSSKGALEKSGDGYLYIV